MSKASESDDCLRDEICTRVLLLYQSHQSARRGERREKRREEGGRKRGKKRGRKDL